MVFYLVYFLVFFLIFYLVFYLIYFFHILSGRWGPAVHIELGRSQVAVQWCILSWEGPRLRSSGAHWPRKVPGWGPAAYIEMGRSQIEVQKCRLRSSGKFIWYCYLFYIDKKKLGCILDFVIKIYIVFCSGILFNIWKLEIYFVKIYFWICWVIWVHI